jgi:hypothetical protein
MAAKAVRMLTTAAEAVVVELSRLAVRLTCSSHISSEQNGGRFSCRGARAAEKISEVGFLYGNPGRPAQHHTNHKPAFHSAHWYCDNVFRSIGFRWCVPPKGSCQGQAAPTCRRQVSRQTGLNRLVSPPFPLLYPTTTLPTTTLPTTTSIWLSCHSV